MHGTGADRAGEQADRLGKIEGEGGGVIQTAAKIGDVDEGADEGGGGSLGGAESGELGLVERAGDAIAAKDQAIERGDLEGMHIAHGRGGLAEVAVEARGGLKRGGRMADDANGRDGNGVIGGEAEKAMGAGGMEIGGAVADVGEGGDADAERLKTGGERVRFGGRGKGGLKA